MGWEDEGSLPGMDEKRALLAQKHASADIRKQQEKERKTKQRNVQKQKILDNRKRNNNNKWIFRVYYWSMWYVICKRRPETKNV